MAAAETINLHRFHSQSLIPPYSHSKIKDSSQKVHPFHQDESSLPLLLPEQSVLPHKTPNNSADNASVLPLRFSLPVQIPHNYKAYDSLLTEDLEQ